MNKLTIGTYCNIKGVSDEVFHAMVQVAIASGFTKNNISRFGRHTNLVITGNGTIWVLRQCDECKQEISISDWLFSLAPDWAVNLYQSKNNGFYYSGQERIVDLSSEEYDISLSDVCQIIATREPKTKQWQPKVGEKYLFHIRGGRSCEKIYKNAVISFIGAKYIVFTDENGREYSRRKAKVDIKPLPPEPTEEEKRLMQILKDLDNQYHDQTEYHPVMAKALIKAGYRKVEPISYADFREHISEHDEDWLYMCDNKHIIVKGE